MAKDIDTGMDKQEMKRLLMKSKSEPVSCAFGQGDEKSMALLMLDKVKQPKAVMKDLEKKFPDANNTRWGTAFVDTDSDAKLVQFMINKPISGVARKLVKTLKGTGFSKVEILLEDGSPVERDSEEDELASPVAADISPSAPVQPMAPPAAAAEPAQPAAQQPQGKLDPRALRQQLDEQAARIAGVAAAAPGMQAQLERLSNDATDNLKTGNLADAAKDIEALRKALDTPTPAAAPIQTPAGAPLSTTYAKSRAVWMAARKKVEGDIEKLRSEILAAYAQDGIADNLDAAFRKRVAPVLTTLDESLAQKLAQAASSPDDTEQQALAKEARDILMGYQRFVASDPTIADLDKNPFMPLSLGATLASTLDALNKTIRAA